MPIATKYLFIVSMDVTKEKEALFNEVYDTEHVPLLLKVPGVVAVSRMKTEPAAFNIGGERKMLDGGSEPNYVAIYEIDSPDVAAEQGMGGGRGKRPLAQRGAPFHLEPPPCRPQGHRIADSARAPEGLQARIFIVDDDMSGPAARGTP
jgi:hypothetical protein